MDSATAHLFEGDIPDPRCRKKSHSARQFDGTVAKPDDELTDYYLETGLSHR